MTGSPLLTGRSAAALRAFCHWLHIALVFFALLGWVVPSAPWLLAHLAFIPGLVGVWLVNRGSCPLNNIETWLTTGQWRNADNAEEGSFLVTLVERYLGLHPTQLLMDRITYGLMALASIVSWVHLWLLGGIPS